MFLIYSSPKFCLGRRCSLHCHSNSLKVLFLCFLRLEKRQRHYVSGGRGICPLFYLSFCPFAVLSRSCSVITRHLHRDANSWKEGLGGFPEFSLLKFNSSFEVKMRYFCSCFFRDCSDVAASGVQRDSGGGAHCSPSFVDASLRRRVSASLCHLVTDSM